jgi:hypothetical protein
VWGGGGCSKHPPAAASNRALVPGEENQKAVLTADDQAEALAAMKSATQAPKTADGPAKAPLKARWSDIPLAVAEACDDKGVEMTCVRKEETDDEFVFYLRTIESWPGKLVIRRGVGDEVYVVKEVWVGRFFEGDPGRIQRVEALIEAFERHLRRLGEQRWFND